MLNSDEESVNLRAAKTSFITWQLKELLVCGQLILKIATFSIISIQSLFNLGTSIFNNFNCKIILVLMGSFQDPIVLAREASRQFQKLEPYNEHFVKKTIREIEGSFDEVDSSNFNLESSGSLFENSNQAKTIGIQNLIRRNVRILNVYHLTRLKNIADISTSVSFLPQSFKNCLTNTESKFLERYLNCIIEYSKPFNGLINVGISQNPPRELYVQIRVNQDCGIIQTEWGQLHLNENTIHFVRRTDVQNLIDQGFVTHIE